MKYSKYLIAIVILLNGCAKNRLNLMHKNSNNLLGNWYHKEKKSLNSNVYINITNKEQFFKNGTLLSTKWFNFKSRDGKDLGEFYITKLFTWQKDSNTIKATFNRCNTSVTKKLLVDKKYYYDLSNNCKLQKHSNKATLKGYRVLMNKLILGDKLYNKVK